MRVWPSSKVAGPGVVRYRKASELVLIWRLGVAGQKHKHVLRYKVCYTFVCVSMSVSVMYVLVLTEKWVGWGGSADVMRCG